MVGRDNQLPVTVSGSADPDGLRSAPAAFHSSASDRDCVDARMAEILGR